MMLFDFICFIKTNMYKKNITIAKTARYYVIGEPGDHITTVWFVCHGYGQLANYFIRNFEVLEKETTLIIAPEGLHRFYWEKFSGRVVASWMTKEDREDDINDYVRYLDDVYEEVMKSLNNKTVKIIGLGFSQGTSTICRWIANKKSVVHGLILWAGSLPEDMTFSHDPFGHFKIYYAVGDEDEFMKEEQRNKTEQVLMNHQLNYEIIRFNGKHELNEAVLLDLMKKI